MILLLTIMPTNAEKMPVEEEKGSLQQANGFAKGNAKKVTFNRWLVITVTSFLDSAPVSDYFKI